MRKVVGRPGGVWAVCMAAVMALWAVTVQADPVTVTGGISLKALEGPSFDLEGPTFSASVFTNPFNNGFDLVPDFFDWCGRMATAAWAIRSRWAARRTVMPSSAPARRR